MKEIRKCKNCNVEFTRPPSNTAIFCSSECRKQYHIPILKCRVCEKEFKAFRSLNKQFCSNKCRYKSHVGSGNPNFNNKWTDTQKENLRKKYSKRLTEGRVKIFTNTRCHLVLEKLINEVGFEVIKESPFPPYSIDCYCPECHIGFEADGTGWHRAKKDAERDLTLLTVYNLHIKRFTDKELLQKSNHENIKAEILKFIEEHSGNIDNRAEVLRSLTLEGKPVNNGPKMFSSETRSRITASLKKYYESHKPWNYGLTKNTSDKMLEIAVLIRKAKYNKVPRKQVCCKYCGKTFEVLETSIQKYCDKRCSAHAPKDFSKRVPWNKGKTKLSDSRVAKQNNRNGHGWAFGLTAETDTRVLKVKKSRWGDEYIRVYPSRTK